jgi:hypothetical protein
MRLEGVYIFIYSLSLAQNDETRTLQKIKQKIFYPQREGSQKASGMNFF